MFSLDPPEDKEPVLGFSLNQSETEEPFEREVFRGFDDEEYRREDSHFWEEKPKICLTEETPIRPSRAQQKVLDSQCRGPEANSLSQLCDHSDMDSSYSGDNNCSLHNCGFLSSYSCRGSSLSSDSDDDEDRCQQCLQACTSYIERPCSAEIPNPIQVVPEQQHHRGLNVKENMACTDEACGGSEKQTAQFVSAHPLHESKSSQMHKCKTASHESRDVGTQTADIPARQTCDAETQCVFHKEADWLQRCCHRAESFIG
ncbi:uncharacterized protein LOC115355584 [Myripristis murdjan]|uniref:uncharacterized protein LOC115355584 n=1 Tax=Myripristis murdjan TaxID=586833 RepID=UPI00117646DF|nr:uncharacterized protein LOC115355584 [Myripristis murdjan]